MTESPEWPNRLGGRIAGVTQERAPRIVIPGIHNITPDTYNVTPDLIRGPEGGAAGRGRQDSVAEFRVLVLVDTPEAFEAEVALGGR